MVNKIKKPTMADFWQPCNGAQTPTKQSTLKLEVDELQQMKTTWGSSAVSEEQEAEGSHVFPFLTPWSSEACICTVLPPPDWLISPPVSSGVPKVRMNVVFVLRNVVTRCWDPLCFLVFVHWWCFLCSCCRYTIFKDHVSLADCIL